MSDNNLIESSILSIFPSVIASNKELLASSFSLSLSSISSLRIIFSSLATALSLSLSLSLSSSISLCNSKLMASNSFSSKYLIIFKLPLRFAISNGVSALLCPETQSEYGLDFIIPAPFS